MFLSSFLQYNSNHRDLNVKEAWKQGVTGLGVVVSILDDGIEKNHPDLELNYVSLEKGHPLCTIFIGDATSFLLKMPNF